jgi:hypothetical protein
MSKNSSVISAFNEEQVQRLTGVTMAQLRYWDRTNFFAPSLTDENRGRPYSRIYSFRDLVCLRVCPESSGRIAEFSEHEAD